MVVEFLAALFHFLFIVLKFITTYFWYSPFSWPLRFPLSFIFESNPFKIFDAMTITSTEISSILSKHFKRNISVSHVSSSPIHAGLTQSCTRLHVQYTPPTIQDNNSLSKCTLPSTLIMKCDTSISAAKFLRMLLKHYERECTFYQYFAARMTNDDLFGFATPVDERLEKNNIESNDASYYSPYQFETPEIYTVRMNPWTNSYMIIMEDVSKRANYKMLSTSDGTSLETYELIFQCLAKFHATCVKSATIQVLIQEHMQVLDTRNRTLLDYLVPLVWKASSSQLKPFFGAKNDSLFEKVTSKVIANIGKYRSEDAKDQCFLLCHSDLRLDNMAINTETKRIVLFDFQAFGLYNAFFDQCMFMGSHLKKQDLLNNGISRLLNTYFTTFHKELVIDGVTGKREEDKILNSAYLIIPFALRDVQNFDAFKQRFLFSLSSCYAFLPILLSAKREPVSSDEDRKHNESMSTMAQRLLDVCEHSQCMQVLEEWLDKKQM